MSYSEMQQLDRNQIAHYFAEKAQKAIDAMWDNGEINEKTIEEWGSTKMRTNKENYTKKVGTCTTSMGTEKPYFKTI